VKKKKPVITFFDGIILASVLIIIGTLAFFVYARGYTGTLNVRVRSDSGEWTGSLYEDKTLVLDGPMGKTVVQIQNGAVRIIESSCPDKTCVKTGAVSDVHGWICCLPNRVLVVVEGGGAQGYDSESY